MNVAGVAKTRYLLHAVEWTDRNERKRRTESELGWW